MKCKTQILTIFVDHGLIYYKCIMQSLDYYNICAGIDHLWNLDSVIFDSWYRSCSRRQNYYDRNTRGAAAVSLKTSRKLFNVINVMIIMTE